ncbi:ParA family protein [Heliorestis convoluta]|uniref:ParA family protein n=1 Tax=Heliorestis convoluta TaxID=356322 RepID=A0A5Q2N219_9FIRM|nr:AAA family ATPase [Heliorestis convoluta]QGG48867.1 ParA family protein [Heliorestis convoluta]
MKTPVITFFNNKGGVGKTSLIYHLSWMFAEQNKRVIAADIDPQANLTAAFLDDLYLEELWEKKNEANTIFRAISPLTGVGDIKEPILKKIEENLYLIPGDVALSSFEETLSETWPASMGDNNLFRPFRIQTAFWQIMQLAAEKVDADIILVDIGPNLGAINRSALISTNFVIIPLGADLFSLQGLKNLGPTVRAWRNLWNKRLENWKNPEFNLPNGEMIPVGYLCQQHSVRLKRPVKAYDKWINRIPAVYRESILEEKPVDLTPINDPLCLATIKHYRSLIPLAQEYKKPIFHLTPADGAIGSHSNAVHEAYRDFEELSRKILKTISALRDQHEGSLTDLVIPQID